MTISSLLDKGVTPTEPVNRYEMSGPALTGDPDVFRYVQRGAYEHGHGGGKASWKGSHSAMSALTLLAFLFFIHLLQTCIQESMMTTGPTMLMLVAANRSRPLFRPSREIHQYEGSDVNALPGPGVYWDKNILIRQKGDPGINGSASEQKLTTSLASDRESQEERNTLTDHYTDYDDRDLFSKAFKLNSNKHYVENGGDVPEYSHSFFHKQLDISGEELTQQKDISLSNDVYQPYDTNVTATSTDPDYNKYYQDKNHHELNAGSTPDWDYYDEYDSAKYTPSLATIEPIYGEYVRDKYELDLHHITNLGNYAWRTVTSIYQQIRSSLSVVQCYELVVCEAHRIARAWGEKGILLASGLSELMLWLYGEDDEHRTLIKEAVTTGKQGQSCWVQMQQCEDKSRDKSMLPIMARLLEKIL